MEPDVRPALQGPRLKHSRSGARANAVFVAACAAMLTAYFAALTANDTPRTTVLSVLDEKPTLLPGNMVPGAVRLVSDALVSDRLLEDMDLTLPQKERLRTELEGGRVRLGKVTLWDNVAVDGDAVRLTSAGYQQNVLISHDKRTFYLPVVAGSTVAITAAADGGGGVTLGVETLVGPILLPPLKVGERVEIPIL